MTQDTTFGATMTAEPPSPVLPMADEADAPDNRRKLMIVGGAGGALVLVIVAFFLLKGGSSSSDESFVVPHHKRPVPAASAAATKPVKLPKHVKAPVGRDPFKALYVAPVSGGAAGAGSTAAGGSTSTSTSAGGSTSTTTTPTTTTGGTTTTTKSSTPTYKPVWIQFKGVSGTTATFVIGYSNGKTLKALRFAVKASTTHAVTFAGSFALESLRNGVATLKYGDGSPFQLDKVHNTMVVG